MVSVEPSPRTMSTVAPTTSIESPHVSTRSAAAAAEALEVVDARVVVVGVVGVVVGVVCRAAHAETTSASKATAMAMASGFLTSKSYPYLLGSPSEVGC